MSTTPRGAHEGWQLGNLLELRIVESLPLCVPFKWLPLRIAT
jgi:hypothetical protein